MWLPALPPKMPYSCWRQRTSNPADVQEVGRAAVRRAIALGDLEANAIAVSVASPGVVHGDDSAVDAWERRRDRVSQVGRERGDPALPREVVSEQRYAADRSGALVLVHALSLRGRVTEEDDSPPTLGSESQMARRRQSALSHGGGGLSCRMQSPQLDGFARRCRTFDARVRRGRDGHSWYFAKRVEHLPSRFNPWSRPTDDR